MLFLWIRIKNASSLAFWLAALLVPAVMLVAAALFGGGDMAIHVGIYSSDDDFQISAEDWVLHRYDDREQLRQDVASMRLELGYAFTDEGITLYTSPATVSERVTNLLIASAWLKSVTGEVGARSLPIAADAVSIQNWAESYLADGPLMERVVLVYGTGVGDEGEAVRHVPFRRTFHGLLALFAQLVAMLAAMGFANPSEREVSKRVRHAGGNLGIGSAYISYVQSGYWAIFVMTAITMFLTIITGALMSPGIWMATDAPAMIIYLLVISAISYVLAITLPESLYPPLIIVGFIFTALMGGVLFDLREVFEAIGFMRLFFPSYYYISLIQP